jgi:hypothetical protein
MPRCTAPFTISQLYALGTECKQLGTSGPRVGLLGVAGVVIAAAHVEELLSTKHAVFRCLSKCRSSICFEPYAKADSLAKHAAPALGAYLRSLSPQHELRCVALARRPRA